MYAQIDYKQFVGNSRLGINEIGCFVTADCNLLEKVGVNVDPPTLNTFYEQNSLYIYDLTDKANDDITWTTVTRKCPQLVVSQIGGAGFPNSDLAQVEFRYNDHGSVVTHFCTVNSASDHSIIDSYDKKVKTPAEYQSVYGVPVAWATFVYHTTATIPSSLPPAAPISAPLAVTASAHVAAPSAPKQLFLPASVSVWHIYAPGGPWTLPYALKNTLDPHLFNGLTYDIVGNPAPNIYLIHTQMFGIVAIYAGPDTVAQFPQGGHGEGEDTSTPAAPAPTTGITANEVIPAPVAAPVTPTVPVIKYALVQDGPYDLLTMEGAKRVNFVSGFEDKIYAAGEKFVAVGKATLPDNITYYMDEASFGHADQTQQTPMTVGIKTTELVWPKKTEEAPVQVAPDADTIQVPVRVESASTLPTAVSEPNGSIAPNSNFTPTLPWQDTFRYVSNNNDVVTYIVKDTIDIYSFVTGNDVQTVPQGTQVDVIGTFIYAGRRMYLPDSSAPKELCADGKGTWYGFPVASLVKQTAENTPFETNDDINQIDHDVSAEKQAEVSKGRKAVLKTAAVADSWADRIKIRKG